MFFFGPNRRLALVVACILTTALHGQFDQSFFRNRTVQFDSAKWAFHPEVTSFVRNTEYQNLITEGRTYLGVQVWPQVSYRVHDHHRLTLGVFTGQDFGGNNFKKLIPTFRWTYLKGSTQINIGAIDGAFNHGLIDPIYHPERWITRRIEQGIQYKHSGKKLQSDLWLNWEQMIYPNSPYREEFTAGGSFLIHLINRPTVKVDLPLQGLVKHEGGEIDQTNLPVTSLYNGYAGIRIRADLANQWKLFVEGGAVGHEDVSSLPADTFYDGKGHLGLVGISKSNWRLDLLYWDSYQFQSPMGNPLFHSRSVQNRNYLFFHRKMVSGRLTYEKNLYNDLALLVRGELLHHPERNWTDFTLECFLRYQPAFLK
jgi:hypothetical protein